MTSFVFVLTFSEAIIRPLIFDAVMPMMAVAMIRSLLVATMAFVASSLSLKPPTSKYEPHLRAKIAHSVAKGERRAQERQAQARAVCSHCSRPPILCVCNVLPQQLIDTSTQILVLQHPNEFRKRNLSTVPLMRLVLKNVQVRVGYSFTLEDLDVVAQAIEAGQQPLLLYPDPYAISLDEVGSDSLPASAITSKLSPQQHGSNNLLILVDGTWTEAKRMVRDSPTLIEKCRQVQFASQQKTIYDAVRKEPQGHCLSTLEATAKALQLLEPNMTTAESAVSHLHSVLESHINAHVLNAETLEPRNVGVAVQRLYEKNKRRREIERSMFDNITVDEVEEKVQPTRKELEGGIVLRSLNASDAALVDSWWQYRSAKSAAMVTRQVEMDQGVACLGIEVNGNLVACILRYQGGALGMLHVKEEYRRRGYATILLQEATRALEQRGEERVAFVVDGNKASEALFTKLGWQRADLHIKKQTGKRRAKRKWIKR